MKKLLLFALILMLCVSLIACANGANAAKPQNNSGQNTKPQQTEQQNEAAVTNLVKSFGSKLQAVSLLAPKDMVAKSMQENYGELVSAELLKEWQGDPLKAPGRTTSSPWPDRIDITNISKQADNTYEVKGYIIEITSVEKEKGGAAAKRPITLIVKNDGSKWVIDDVKLGDYVHSATEAITYKSSKYGFDFSLPNSWKGYKIVDGIWEGLAIAENQGDKIVEKGPQINIRHPLWTKKNPRQDIPIMVFTIKQWNDLQKDKFHIGAAPIGPSELGRNSKYVFALPARYNYAFPAGYEEVQKILDGKPLKAFQTE